MNEVSLGMIRFKFTTMLTSVSHLDKENYAVIMQLEMQETEIVTIKEKMQPFKSSYFTGQKNQKSVNKSNEIPKAVSVNCKILIIIDSYHFVINSEIQNKSTTSSQMKMIPLVVGRLAIG